MFRSNKSTIGIYQRAFPNPSNAGGANSYNVYDNVFVQNSYLGIKLYGYLNYPDISCIIKNSTVGADAADDIGNSNTLTYGIYIYASSDIEIYNNLIRNVTVTGAVKVYGLYLQFAKGINNKIYNNIIHDIKTTYYTYTSVVSGMEVYEYIGASFDVYNNSIYGLEHGTTSPMSTKVIYGLVLSGFGVGNFYFNSVRIDEDEFPSSACFYNGTTASGTVSLENNNFANFSPNGSISKYCVYITGGTTNLDYNNYFISTGINNYVGFLSNNYLTLTDWQTGSGFDLNSISADPLFTSSSNLLPLSGSPVIGVGIPISGITTDIVGTTRSITAPTLGAYEVTAGPSIWSGATDNDWNNSTNWNPEGTPGTSTDVIIPNVTNDPIINQGANNPAECNNLTIESGAILTINYGKSLTVNGTLTNNAGTSGLILKSDATGTASLLHNTANVDATIERYLTGNPDPNGTMDFHLVSVPLNAAITAAQFMGMYLYEFDPGTQVWVSLGSPTTTPLDNNKGYMVFYPNTNSTIDFTGQLNDGTFTVSTPTNAADEFNLVPNPYPSPIDWDATSGWTKTNLQDAFYIWNPVSNNYVTWSSGAGTAGSGIIPVGQSFFVKSNGSNPILTMTNDIRMHDAQSFYKDYNIDVPEVFHLSVSDSVSSDELVVRFSSLANGDRGLYDADKLYGAEDAPQMYSISEDGFKMTINALNHTGNTVTVPVGLEYFEDGQFEFTANGFDSFESTATIFLEDKLLNKMINLKETPIYHFAYSADDDVMRFNLYFYGVNSIDENNTNNSHIWAHENQINIQIPALTGQQASVELFDITGQLLFRKQLVLSSPTTFTSPRHIGVAIVRITTFNQVYSEKVFIR